MGLIQSDELQTYMQETVVFRRLQSFGTGGQLVRSADDQVKCWGSQHRLWPDICHISYPNAPDTVFVYTNIHNVRFCGIFIDSSYLPEC